MSVKDNAKYFFKSKSASVLFWLVIWLAEYYLLRWVLNKYAIPQNIIYNIELVGAVLGIFLLLYWIKEKRSTEMLLYFILIMEFMLFRLDNQAAFEAFFHIKFSYFKYILAGYAAIRALFLNRVFSFIYEVFSGLKEAIYDKAAERKAGRDEIQKEREEKLHRRKEKNAANRQHRIDLWKHIGNTIHTIVSGIAGNFTAIFDGISRVDKTTKGINQDGSQPQHTDTDRKIIRLSISYLMIPIIICVTLFVISLIIAKSETLEAIFSNTAGTGLTVKKIIEVIMSVTVLIIVILIFSAILYNIVIQILIFVFNIRKDLQKTVDDEDRSITNNVLYALTFGIFVYWVKKYYPFDFNDLATDFSTGQLIVYPLFFVLIAIIISFFTNNITIKGIKDYLEKHNAGKIWDDIYELVANSINAAVNYLKLVTGDFLLSIKQLAEEDDLINDLEEDDNE